MVWIGAKKAKQPYIEMHVVSVLISLLPPVIVLRFWTFSNISAELMALLAWVVI